MIRLAAVALVASAALAQPAEAKGYIGIVTRNAGPLIAWYKANFDLALVRTVRPDNANLTVTILDGPLATVEIISRPDAQPAGPAASRLGIFKTGFMVDNLTPWITRWQAAGVTIAAGPFDEEAPPLRSIILRDPDGNAVHVTQALAAPAP